MLVRCVGAFVLAAAWDASPAVQLSWDAPAGCPTEGDVRARIDELLPDSERSVELRVVARAHADERGIWTVALRFETAQGVAERTLTDASSCKAAAEAAAVVIAIAIDPELALGGVPEPTAPPADDPVAAEPASRPASPVEIEATSRRAPATPDPIDPAPSEATHRPSRTRPGGAIALGPAVSFGTLPRTAGVGRLVGAVLWRRIRVGIGVAFAGGTPIRRDDARVALWRWTVDVHVCPVFGLGRWVEIVPCGGIEAGQTLVTSSNLVAPSNPRDPWVAAFVQPAVAVLATRRLAIFAGGQVVVPFQRRRYLVDGAGEVFVTGPVGGGAFVALEVRIP